MSKLTREMKKVIDTSPNSPEVRSQNEKTACKEFCNYSGC